MSKRKPNNNNARHYRMARSTLKDTALVFVVSEQQTGVTAYSIKHKDRLTVTQKIAKAVQTVPYKWSVYIAVFCRDQFGTQYTKGQWIATKDYYFQSELIDLLNEQHQELIKSANPQHKMNAGWIAIPVSGEISDQHADELFTKQGAWEVLAPWEQKESA